MADRIATDETRQRPRRGEAITLGILDDSGLVASLADDLSLRDVVQALRYARANMFDPIPGHQEGGGNGFVGNSTRVAELLNTRRRLPALATTAHVAALLPNATATERETVSLMRAGILRKVVQPQWRRAGEPLGEVLVETATLEQLVRDGPASSEGDGLSDDTQAAFVAWLRGEGGEEHGGRDHSSPRAITIHGQTAPRLDGRMADELVRAGFLVGHGARRVVDHRSGGSGQSNNSSERSGHGDVFARPEDRTSLLSLETVAKAASGSFGAVGGIGAVYTAGGGGARSALPLQTGCQQNAAASTEDLLLAVPGHGAFVKLVSAALAHLVSLLARTPFREAPETMLQERWNAAGSNSGGHGSYRRVTLSRTRKWKDLYGLSFNWVLAEAVGAGLVEVFETGSVGRGIRLPA
ncbi:hypothetical protein CMQ_5915 [Grosmannia clavigera kw1407]|uniref:Serine-threonine protein kinase 19 n=1 Tax=Grosmannia clavigera (strain kw1407 / UAMH 11150) TaxID=655863 RepID=F0XIG9_GROCL|nr:uncharacterized protein CMQ_5915 [Grosmannia clavigera kw1407]EFX02554.1 hypothetical protein CMQ_5915 [Grosmannia clavigera kw1407]